MVNEKKAKALRKTIKAGAAPKTTVYEYKDHSYKDASGMLHPMGTTTTLGFCIRGVYQRIKREAV